MNVFHFWITHVYIFKEFELQIVQIVSGSFFFPFKML